MELWQRLSTYARHSILLAHREAVVRRTSEIDTEHMLLGLLRVGQGEAYQVIKDLGVDPEHLRLVLGQQLSGPESDETLCDVSFTGDVLEALGLSAAQADAEGVAEINTGYLLLGLVSIGQGLAHDVLAAQGVSEQSAQEAIRATERVQVAAREGREGKERDVGHPPPAPQLRVGLGYDLHRLVGGRPLRLGGITLDYPKGLAGHSDADVVLHAIADALLGACALGDIGQHFPDTDPAYVGADSRKLLSTVVAMVKKQGFAVVNVDVTVIAEEPKIGPNRDAMRQALAQILGMSVEAVSVKAKTNEGMGGIGRGEAIAALAVALVERPSDE